MNLLAKCQKVYEDLRGNEVRLSIMKTKECSLCYPDIGARFARPAGSGAAATARFLLDKPSAQALCLKHYINLSLWCNPVALLNWL